MPGGTLVARRGQVPADRLAAALPVQYLPLLLQPQAGTGVTLRGPAEDAADSLPVCRAAISGQQAQQSPPVLIARRRGRSHAGNLPSDGPAAHLDPAPALTALAAQPPRGQRPPLCILILVVFGSRSCRNGCFIRAHVYTRT